MKKIALLALFGSTAVLLAQTNQVTLPDEMMNTPIRDWQLNGTTLLVVVAFLGRGFKALRAGGGLKGVWSGIVSGTNVPTANPPQPSSPPKT